MSHRCESVILFLGAMMLGGCATTRDPVLYPNEHFQTVGQATADQDIAACASLAEQAGAEDDDSGTLGETAKQTAGSVAIGAASGAVGGAIVGAAGAGSAIGAAAAATGAILRALFFSSGNQRSESAYTVFVARCLKDKGYDLVGWK